MRGGEVEEKEQGDFSHFQYEKKAAQGYTSTSAAKHA